MVEFKKKRVNLKSGGLRTYYYRISNGVSKRISKYEYHKQNGGLFGSRIESGNSFRMYDKWKIETSKLLEKLMVNNEVVDKIISDINRENLKRKNEESLKGFNKNKMKNSIFKIEKLLGNKDYLEQLKGRPFWEGDVIKKIVNARTPDHVKKIKLYLGPDNRIIGTLSEGNKEDNIIIVDSNNSSGIDYRLVNRNDGKRRKITLGVAPDTERFKRIIGEAREIGAKIGEFMAVQRNYQNLIKNYQNKEVAYGRYLTKPEIELDEVIVPRAINIFVRGGNVFNELLGLHLDKYIGTRYGENFDKLESRHFYDRQKYNDWLIYHFLIYLYGQIMELKKYEQVRSIAPVIDKMIEDIRKKYKRDYIAEKFFHKRNSQGNVINTKTYKYLLNMRKNEAEATNLTTTLSNVSNNNSG